MNSPKENNRYKILYIEDDMVDRMAFERASVENDFNFDYNIVSSLKDALELLKFDNFDVILSDFNLQDGTAIDLLPQITNIPMIIVTGAGSEEIAVKVMKAGAYDYLIKDFDRSYLKILPITVGRTIELKQHKDELDQYRTQLEKLVQERTNELVETVGKMQESEAKFRNIFNSSSDGILITDYEYNILEVNHTLSKNLSFDPKSITSRKITEFLNPGQLSIIKERRVKLKEGIPVGNQEVEIILSGNRIIPAEISSVPIIYNNKPAVLTVIRDITERKLMERKLIETIIKTEEDERSRIAKDLHDEIGPLISALKIYLTSFLEAVEINKKNNLAEQMKAIIRDMIESVKNISNDMSPHILVNFGILAAIKSIISIFSKDINIELRSNLHDQRFPEITESVIYRVIKELINNTIKHSQAKIIFIRLDYIDNGLLCNYRDDGIGFDLESHLSSPSKGMGLSNIRSRIISLGGEFTINTSPNKGFEITFLLKTHQL